MPKLRKYYSAEEKVRIVLASLSDQWTQAQISSKYGVHSTQISHWKREFKSRVADI
ncbi:MAG: transposase [Legionellales bacterium]|nr:transposase [Legionellales bacterium]